MFNKKCYLAYFLLLSSPYLAFSASFDGYDSLNIENFSGGLNTTIPASKLAKEFSPDMRNVFIHRTPGSIVKRNGFAVAGSTTVLTDVRFGFTFYKENGSVEYIVSDGSRVLSTADFNSYVIISSGLSNTVGLQAEQVRNKVWITNGNDSVFTWDGTVKQVLDGTRGLPNVPKFRYIKFWQERVWGLNTAADASSLDFSALVTTAAEIITPDDPRAWQGSNRFNIGRGDGQIGSALWIQNGRLYIGKERSIWRMLGNTSTSYYPDIVLKNVGVASNDSVVVMDNNAYFKGNNNAVYEFNGQTERRISDGIVSQIQAVNDAVNNTITFSWDTQPDYIQATSSFTFGSTATAGGYVTMIDSNNVKMANVAASNNPGVDYGLQPIYFSNGGYVVSPYSAITSTVSYPPYGLFYVSALDVWRKCHTGDCNGGAQVVAYKIHVRNARTGDNQVVCSESSNSGGSFVKVNCPVTNFVGNPTPYTTTLFTGQDINDGNFQLSVETTSAQSDFDIYLPTNTGAAGIYLLPATTVQYISNISSASNLVSWTVFDSIRNTNGGTINYFYRTANSAAGVLTAAWNPITPGNAVNAAASNNFIQWASTIQAVNLFNPSNIDRVTISYLAGSGNRDRPFGILWNREYWLSVATGTNNTSIQYVKAWKTHSNPDAWNPLFNQDIRCFFKNGDSALYGGSAGSPVIYRLDYGTNDNGMAISAYYDTPEFGFDNGFLEKTWYETWVDVVPEMGANFTLGISSNASNFYFQTKSMESTGNSKQLFFKNVGGTPRNTWKFRFYNAELDKRMQIDAAAILYKGTTIRSE